LYFRDKDKNKERGKQYCNNHEYALIWNPVTNRALQVKVGLNNNAVPYLDLLLVMDSCNDTHWGVSTFFILPVKGCFNPTLV